MDLGSHNAEDQVVEAGREEEVGQEVHQELDQDQDQAGRDDQNLESRYEGAPSRTVAGERTVFPLTGVNAAGEAAPL